MSMFLTLSEIRALTERKTRPAQRRRLKAMGIPTLPDDGGNVKVLKSVVARAGGDTAEAELDYLPNVSWMMRKQRRDRSSQT